MKVLEIILPIIILILGILRGKNDNSWKTWYDQLKKPWFTPPGYVFPIAWTYLYLSIGYSFALVIESNSYYKYKAIIFFLIQLFFNYSFSPLLFKKKLLYESMICIFFTDIFSIISTYYFFKV